MPNPKNNTPEPKRGFFTKFTEWTSVQAGHPATFVIALAIIAVWAVSGPIFQFSDTWQLVINTSTTIITFLMVFLIQCSQNRDTMALQIKLDEIIRVTEGAHNALLDLERLDEQEIAAFRAKYQEIARLAREKMERGEDDTGTASL